MSIRSGPRKFKPGQATHVRHSWRGYIIIGLMGLIGVVILLMLRGSVPGPRGSTVEVRSDG